MTTEEGRRREIFREEYSKERKRYCGEEEERGGSEEICFETRKTIGMEYRVTAGNSCNCLHDTVGGFTRPLERVLDEFLKFYITLQVTATLATPARIKYTEACIDSPVLSA